MMGSSDFEQIFPRRAGRSDTIKAAQERFATCVSTSAAGQATGLTSSTLRIRAFAVQGLSSGSPAPSTLQAVARVGATVLKGPIDSGSHGKEESFALDGSDGILQLEVISANRLREESLGWGSLRIAGLLPGEWHRRTVQLTGYGYLEFEVRLDSPPGELLAEKLLQSTGLGLLSLSSVGSASCTVDKSQASKRPGCISLPDNWNEGADLDEEHPYQAASQGKKGRSLGRSCTISVPDDLFEEPSLEVGDPALGPAAMWEFSAQAYAASRAHNASQSTKSWADLDAVLTADTTARGSETTQETALPSLWSSAGVGKATAPEEAPFLFASSASSGSSLFKTGPSEAVLSNLFGDVSLKPAEQSSGSLGKAGSSAGASSSSSPLPMFGSQSSLFASALAAPSSTGGASSGSSLPAFGTATAAKPPFAGGASSLFSGLASEPSSAASASSTLFAASAPVTTAPSKAAPAKAAPAKEAPAADVKEAGEPSDLLVKAVQRAEESLQSFRSDAQQKQFRLEVKKSLNTRVSQISATWMRIRDCTVGLCQTLDRCLSDSNASRCRFAEYAMAERLADDAEVGVKAQPRAAWSIAQVAVRVFLKFPAVKDLFWGFMFRASPYLIPRFEGSHVGRTGPAPGQRADEAFTDFADRMASYLRLQLAIQILSGDLAAVWQWFAKTLNKQPAPLAAPLLHAALDVGGSDAQGRYRQQFVKLVAYIEREYMPELEGLQGKVKGEEASQLRASNVRLWHWLDDFRASGRAPVPEGRNVEVLQEEELNPDA